jgi:hypothetical protein
VGIPHEGIALCIGDNGIDDKTLRKHFPRELATSKIIWAKTADGLEGDQRPGAYRQDRNHRAGIH